VTVAGHIHPQWRFDRRIKEKMTSDSDKGRQDRLVKALLGGLSAEEGEQQRRRDYRRGYPKATEPEIQLLMAADDKAGYPPVCIGHARYIMRTSAGTRRPAPTAKDFDDAAREIAATHRENLRENEVLGAGMTFCNWDRRPAVLFEQGTYALLAPGAPWTEVDRHDVFGASVLSQEEWRRVFRAYAPLDLRALHAKIAARRNQLVAGVTDRRPAPTVRGFDDAAREAAANYQENYQERLAAGFPFWIWDQHLELAKTLGWVAEEIGDREMGLWAAAMQHEVREELGALNELGRRQGTTH
jgi:hypothetical protein